MAGMLDFISSLYSWSVGNSLFTVVSIGGRTASTIFHGDELPVLSKQAYPRAKVSTNHLQTFFFKPAITAVKSEVMVKDVP